MLQLDWQTVLQQIINFAVLFGLLYWFLFRPLRTKLNERARLIAETLQSARDQEADAARLRAEYERRLHGLREEADDIIAEARREADPGRTRPTRPANSTALAPRFGRAQRTSPPTNISARRRHAAQPAALPRLPAQVAAAADSPRRAAGDHPR